MTAEPDMRRYAARRARVLELLGDDALLIVAAGPELRVGRDAEVRYQPDSELYYLTGYTEPEAVAVLGPCGADKPFTMFVRPRDPERETWTGVRGGLEAATELFGADAAYDVAGLAEELPKLTEK